MKEKEQELDYTKGEKIKKYIQIGLDITIITLLLFYLIHIKFGIEMQKIDITVETNCEGKIINTYGIPENISINLTNIQETIYQEYKKNGVTTWNYQKKSNKQKT